MKKKIILILLLTLLTTSSDCFAKTKEKKKDRGEVIIENAKKDYAKETKEGNLTSFDQLYGSNEKPVSNVVQGGVEENVNLSLNLCIQKALVNNPNILSALNNSEIYKTHIGQAWSNYFPKFGATSGLSRNKALVINYPIPTSQYTYYSGLSSTFSQLIFDFGKTKAQADMAKKTYEATTDTLQETINETVYGVSQSYYNLLYAIQQKKVYDDTVKRYELHLKQAQGFYSIGTKPKIDVITAEYNLSNAKLGNIKAQNDIKLAYTNLNNAMGLPNQKNYQVTDSLDSKKYEINLDDVMKKAFDSRPELLAQMKKAKSSEILIKASKRAFMPDLQAFGSYQTGGSDNFTQNNGYQIGGQFSYTTTNFYLLKKQMDEAKATHNKDLSDLEVKKQNLHREVEEAYINVINSQESIPVSVASLKQAKEQYDLACGRYKTGVGDQIELKDAENTYRTAQLDYYKTLLTYDVSIASLEKVVGVKIAIAGIDPSIEASSQNEIKTEEKPVVESKNSVENKTKIKTDSKVKNDAKSVIKPVSNKK